MVCIFLVNKMLVMLHEQFVFSHFRHTISHIISNTNTYVGKMVSKELDCWYMKNEWIKAVCLLHLEVRLMTAMMQASRTPFSNQDSLFMSSMAPMAPTTTTLNADCRYTWDRQAHRLTYTLPHTHTLNDEVFSAAMKTQGYGRGMWVSE